MKEMDLMFALTDVDDELLQGRGEKKTRPGISRAVAAAVAAAVLTVTVFAAAGVEYWFGAAGDGGSLRFTYPQETVTIRREAREELNQWFTEEWENGGMPGWLALDEAEQEETAQSLYMASGCAEMNGVKSLQELESYLDLELELGPEIEEMLAMDGAYNFGDALGGNIMFCGPTYEEALAEFDRTGQVTLHGVQIRLCMNQGTGAVSYVEIILPLTEEYWDFYPSKTVYSFEKEGETYSYSNGSREFLVACQDFTGEFGSKYGSRCVAMYREGGVGYCLCAIVYPSVNGRNLGDVEAEEIILPLLEGIE